MAETALDPIPPKVLLEEVADAAGRAFDARAEFEAAIRAAHPSCTVRAIAEAAGLSPSRIGQLVHPEAKP